MAMNTTRRKQFAKLNRADLSEEPVWEWVSGEDEEQDETWVRPTSHRSVPKSEFAQFVVNAVATLRDGGEVPACVEVTTSNEGVHCEPAFVFLLDRHLEFLGMETSRMFSKYTKTLNNHPVAWRLAVLIDGESTYRTGEVDHASFMKMAMGFMDALERMRNKN